MFKPVDGNVNFPAQELAVARFWKDERIYEKSLENRKDAPPFVFYEGPPTANGMPHPGHCLTRAMKDLFPRYRTMRGYRCERKAGWDTHGLPVEVEVCKELGIHSKEEIEAYGIEPFIQKCQQSVWRYMAEWEKLTERIGFWVDLKNAYATYHQSFVESVWWSLKELYNRGLLYQGHKIVWWWAQGGTALSSGEVGEGYRSVADPSVYVRFPCLDENADEENGESLLVWTTTPWTLPSNQFVAVNPNLQYSILGTQVDGKPHRLFVATDLVAALRIKSKEELPEVDDPVMGATLVDHMYRPPFDYYYSRIARQKGQRLDGLEDFAQWRVVAGDFVTTDSGTGLVHQAGAFGETDHAVLLEQQARFKDGTGPHLLNPVAPDGKFTHEAPEYCRGRWVKDCDKDIVRDLKQRGLLFHQEQYVHDYPFCPRAEQDALIQYPRQSWFIRTSQFKDDMLANNAKINWLPEHIKNGRFGKFLETNVDWALSRERYWGTPLPIWKCQSTGQMEAVGSYDELMAKPGIRGGEVWEEAKRRNPNLPDDLRIHKPYIDEIVYDSPFEKGAHMRRVSEVIDCWYDAGSMPFAQWGYPHAENSDEHFKSQFPADFISEAIDQTRGWFYAQLAISTLMFGGLGTGGSQLGKNKTAPSPQPPAPYPHPFKNCIVLGHMLGEDGQKMSKRKRNYREPGEIFDKYGADALRWYFFANQPPWTSIRYNEQSIKDSIPEFLLRLWNTYSFFVIYANIDGFAPSNPHNLDFSPPLDGEGCAPGTRKNPLPNPPHKGEGTNPSSTSAARSLSQRNELDRWIVSELNRTITSVTERMDAYDNYAACQRITEFVDALSNWYVRRSRDRFWMADKQAVEKLDAYWTLYECLLTTTRLVAPFVPFLAETMWQNLAQAGSPNPQSEIRNPQSHSVHLCDYPKPDETAIDEALSERMNLVRLISSLGRNARNAAALKVRQPLERVEVILADTRHQAWLAEHAAMINEELNVKRLEFCDDPTPYVEHEVVPNFKLLGPKLGKLLPRVKKWLSEQTGADLLANIRDNGQIDLTLDGQAIALTPEEVEVRIKPKPGWTSANGQGVVVVLSTELTTELLDEGVANDVVRLIQDRRKEIGCEYTDRIEVGLVTESPDVRRAVESFTDHIVQETLATRLVFEPLASLEAAETKLGDATVKLFVRTVQNAL